VGVHGGGPPFTRLPDGNQVNEQLRRRPVTDGGRTVAASALAYDDAALSAVATALKATTEAKAETAEVEVRGVARMP
jgi:hypothetical protein